MAIRSPGLSSPAEVSASDGTSAGTLAQDLPGEPTAPAPRGLDADSGRMRGAGVFTPVLDQSDTWKYLAAVPGLSPTGQAQVMAQLEKKDAEARRAGRLFGGKGWDTAEINATVAEYRAAKRSQAEDDGLFRLALKHADEFPTLGPLVHQWVVLKGLLRTRKAERGRTGVRWAERNTRHMATDIKKEIRALDVRILAEARSLNLARRLDRGRKPPDGYPCPH